MSGPSGQGESYTFTKMLLSLPEVKCISLVLLGVAKV